VRVTDVAARRKQAASIGATALTMQGRRKTAGNIKDETKYYSPVIERSLYHLIMIATMGVSLFGSPTIS